MNTVAFTRKTLLPDSNPSQNNTTLHASKRIHIRYKKKALGKKLVLPEEVDIKGIDP